MDALAALSVQTDLANRSMHVMHKLGSLSAGSRLRAVSQRASLGGPPRVEETVHRYLECIHKSDESIGSFISVDRDGALKQVCTLPEILLVVMHL